MQSRAWVGFGIACLASLAWWSCSNSSASGGGAPDGGEAGEAATDGTIGEGPECNPCFQFCACTPGEMVYSAAQCMTYTCPPTGVWGATGCTGPSMCADASDEQAMTMDATREASAEASSDAPADVTSDAVSEDAPGDALGDAAEASAD